MNANIKKKIIRFLIYAALIAIVISIIYPFIFMILGSFKGKSEYQANMFGLPREWDWKNWRIAIEKYQVIKYGWHSFVVTVSSVLLNVSVCTMGAYAFSKLKFRFSEGVLALIIACMMVPKQILMIPVYLIMSKLGLINNFASAILFNVATSIPFGTYMLSTQCQSVPDEILEAAEIDGASVVKRFINIVLPLVKPAIMTLVVLNFLTFWNELLYSMLFLQSNATRTLTVEVATSVGKYVTNVPLMLTGLLINCLPSLIVFVVFQKYISKGIMVGAVK